MFEIDPIRANLQPMKQADDRPPRWIWIAVLSGSGLVVLTVAGGILALALGAADPPVAGPPIWHDSALDWAGESSLLPQTAAWYVAPVALPNRSFTLRLSAQLAAGSDPSAAWGIWIAQAGGTRAVWAISGEGYFTIRACTDQESMLEDCPAVRPEWRWGAYNRLHPPGETNQITLHVEDSGELRLRLNDERMGAFVVDMTGEWGIWVRGGRENLSALHWEEVSLYAKS